MADKRITDLPAATAATGKELVEISQLSLTVKISAATISAQASDNSYNDSAAGFVAAGFQVGDRVSVSGFTGNVANNIVVGVITALTPGKMTIGGTDGDVIVDDAAGETVTVAKWTSRRASVALGLTPPLAASFPTAINAPTVVDGQAALIMTSAAARPAVRARLAALPGGNFSVRVKMRARRTANFNGAGVAFRDTGGKYVCLLNVHNSGCVIGLDTFSSSTVFNAGAAFAPTFSTADSVPEWLRADFDAASNDITAYWSYNGIDWISIGTSNYLGTADAFGPCCSMNHASSNCVAFFEHLAIVT